MDVAPASPPATSSLVIPDGGDLDPAGAGRRDPAAGRRPRRARRVTRESVRLAFIAALQHLARPPARRADPARGAALACRGGRRAAGDERRRGQQRAPPGPRRARSASTATRHRASPPLDDRELLAAYIDAFDRHDVDALVGLLRDDAILEMPPFELWLRGTDDIRRWLLAVDALAPRAAHARQRERVTRRRRLPAGDAGRPADGVRHPRARRRRRTHQRHPRLPRPGAVRTVRPSYSTRFPRPAAPPAAASSARAAAPAGTTGTGPGRR